MALAWLTLGMLTLGWFHALGEEPPAHYKGAFSSDEWGYADEPVSAVFIGSGKQREATFTCPGLDKNGTVYSVKVTQKEDGYWYGSIHLEEGEYLLRVLLEEKRCEIWVVPSKGFEGQWEPPESKVSLLREDG
jgi:hypothetical protein